MSHELEMIDGKASMVYFGETPWHGLGQVADESMLWDIPAMMTAANLNRTIVTEEVQTSTCKNTGYYATMYEGADKVLGIVSDRYTPLQNVEAFDFFKPWLDTKMAALHTAGALFDGKRVWVLAQIGKGAIEVAKGDDVARFVLLSNSHDGKTSVRVGFTPVRVVCANTLSWAISDKASQLIRVRHTKDVKVNVENLRDIMDLANNQFVTNVEQYQLLCTKQINAADLRKYVKIVFGFDKDEEKEGGLSTRAKNIVEEIIKHVDNGVGQRVASTRGTLYWAYNGVNNYLNYSDGRNSQNIMDKLWFGTNTNVNQKALDLALSWVENVP